MYAFTCWLEVICWCIFILHLHTGMHDRQPSVIDVLHYARAHMTKLLVNIHERTNIATVYL